MKVKLSEVFGEGLKLLDDAQVAEVKVVPHINQVYYELTYTVGITPEQFQELVTYK